VINPITITTGNKDESFHDDDLMEKQHLQKPKDPQVLMHHIPDNQPKIYASLQQQQQQQQQQIRNNCNIRNGDGPEAAEGEHAAATPAPDKRIPTPREIMRGLNKYVLALAVGVYNHYKGIFCAETYVV
jgi:hypothetical protein